MVRYARAKGSKASNERRFEEATSWSEMKQQLIDAQRRAQSKVTQVRSEIKVDKHENEPVETSWAPFDAPSCKSHVKKFPNTFVKNNTKIEKNKLIPVRADHSHSHAEAKNAEENYEDVGQKRKKRNKINSLLTNEESVSEQEFDRSMSKRKKKEMSVYSEEESHLLTMQLPDNSVISDDVKKKKKKRNQDSSKLIYLAEEGKAVGESYEDVSPQEEKKKMKKKNKINSVWSNEGNVTESDSDKNVSKSKNQFGKEEMEIRSKDLSSSQCSVSGFQMHCSKTNEEVGNDIIKRKRVMDVTINNEKKKSKFQKEKGGFLVSQQKGPSTNTINLGSRIAEICYFDGFPVLKEDWERLDELKKKMLEQNIPQDEMKAQLKVLRRQAEKSLARAKKKVCLRCRQQGHFLADCPSNSNDLIESVHSNICFKCGSTEHSYLSCKVVKNDSFRFASCFVCGEQGHIARQCPDNPRGMYPTGGACKICGDVTHLKKDCPQYQEIQQKSTITLQTLSSNNALEDLETDVSIKIPSLPQKFKKKRVKF